ncbi:MAG: replication initiation protein RepC [Alphaproteobacteria bacterium]|nr:replication initiation protein RepC [Alphaproteobacteria bacterium]
MQSDISHQIQSPGGGRIASPKLRHSLEQCEEFDGLEKNVNRYDLLLLVKRVGKAAGFTPRMIALLDYYMSFTRDIDWEEGGRPIVYQSLAKTALDMGVSERQIQILENQLFEVGALTWHDSGNHRRFGHRCEETGQILFAYGAELTPLAYLKEALENKLQEKQLYDKAWMETKRQISYYRRQIRSILLEAEMGAGESDEVFMLEEADLIEFNGRYEKIAVSIRTYMDLIALRELLDKHKELHAVLSEKVAEHDQKASRDVNNDKLLDKDSSKDESNDVHYKYTNKKQLNKLSTRRSSSNFLQEGVADPSKPQSKAGEEGKGSKIERKEESSQGNSTILSTGLQHVTLKQLLNISSDRLKSQLPMEPRPMNANDFVEASYGLIKMLGISQNSWGHACLTLGRIGAAVCVILTDQANLREENRVRKPGAYFNAMVNRAKTGDLKLHKSVMGHLKRDLPLDASNSNEQLHSKKG